MYGKFKDDNALLISIAVLLYHIIKADNVETEKEMNKFHDILEKNFKISNNESIDIYNNVKNLDGNIEQHIKYIKGKFSNDLALKAQLMQSMNEIILSDGIIDCEYQAFEDIRIKLF